MGQSISSIEHTTGVDGEQILLGEMLKCKREAYIEKLKRTKNLTDEINREVHGGKTVNRVTDVRIVDNDEDDHDKQIRTCLYEFILAAQGGDVPKSAAVYGAEKLLSVGLVDACFLADPGQGREKKGFVVLFLNYAFVRVDYLIYSYTATDTLKGACYVADIGVLPLDKLRFDEIEYLLEQSLNAEYKANNDDEAKAIHGMKVQLMANKKQYADLETKEKVEDITAMSEAMTKTAMLIKNKFDSLGDYPDPNLTGTQGQASDASQLPGSPE